MSQEYYSHDQPLLGMGQMCCGLILLPAMDAIAKVLGQDLGSAETAWWRFAIQLIMLPALLLFLRAWQWQGSIALWQMLPGAFIAVATVFFFHALQYMSMAKTITIFFVEPMIITILAAIFLRETIRVRRIIAIIVGFIGAAIVIRPQNFETQWFVFLPLGSALCFAIYFLLLRRVAKRAHPLMTQWMVALGAVITLSILLQLPRVGIDLDLFVVRGIRLELFPLILALGFFAIVGHSLLISASSKAPANVLAPLAYVELVSATMLGFVLFHEIPDMYTILGGCIIIISGLYLIYREHQQHRNISTHDIVTTKN